MTRDSAAHQPRQSIISDASAESKRPSSATLKLSQEHDDILTHIGADTIMGREDKSVDELCAAIIADLRFLRNAYIFQHDQIDRKPVQDHLKNITQECLHLRQNPALFATLDQYKEFTTAAAALAAQIAEVIGAWKKREMVRTSIQEELREEYNRVARPTYKPALLPWNQFLNDGAPGLPVTSKPGDNPFWPPVKNLPHQYEHVQNSSMQVLPPSGQLIPAKWLADFTEIMDSLLDLHPSDKYFSMPPAKRLLLGKPYIECGNDILVPKMQIVDLGERPYGVYDEWTNALGDEDLPSVAEALGDLAGVHRIIPQPVFKAWVLRQWRLSETEGLLSDMVGSIGAME